MRIINSEDVPGQQPWAVFTLKAVSEPGVLPEIS